jgi:hypothetical protein
MYRKGALDPLRQDLKDLASFIRSRAPEASVRRFQKSPKYTAHILYDRLQGTAYCKDARSLLRVAVLLVQLLREVPCQCRPKKGGGHWEECDRIKAMKWQFHMMEGYGIFYTTDPDAPIPLKMKELHKHAYIETDPGHPGILLLDPTA